MQRIPQILATALIGLFVLGAAGREASAGVANIGGKAGTKVSVDASLQLAGGKGDHRRGRYNRRQGGGKYYGRGGKRRNHRYNRSRRYFQGHRGHGHRHRGPNVFFGFYNYPNYGYGGYGYRYGGHGHGHNGGYYGGGGYYYEGAYKPKKVAPEPRPQQQADTGVCLQQREYQSTIVVAGEEVPAYGPACLQPDGSWKVIRLQPIPEDYRN